MKKCILTVIACWLIVVLSSYMRVEAVDFPEGYRQWNHVKTHLVGANNPAWPKYGGFNHYYANDKALEGYRSNKFEDGSVIVVEVREAHESKGDQALGKRKFIDVMVKDSKKYASTGGWGFEEFMEGDKTKAALNDEGKNKCFSCHQSRSVSDLVLSTIKE